MAIKKELPILKGTQAAYDAIETKNPDIIYITVDTGSIYLGDIRLGGSDGGKSVKDITFADDTAVFTVSYSDGATKEIDLALESVIQDVNYDGETHRLTLTLVSGATTEIDLSDLVDALPDVASEITDETPDGSIPTVGAVKGMMAIGAF